MQTAELLSKANLTEDMELGFLLWASLCWLCKQASFLNSSGLHTVALKLPYFVGASYWFVLNFSSHICWQAVWNLWWLTIAVVQGTELQLFFKAKNIVLLSKKRWRSFKNCLIPCNNFFLHYWRGLCQRGEALEISVQLQWLCYVRNNVWGFFCKYLHTWVFWL